MADLYSITHHQLCSKWRWMVWKKPAVLQLNNFAIVPTMKSREIGASSAITRHLFFLLTVSLKSRFSFVLLSQVFRIPSLHFAISSKEVKHTLGVISLVSSVCVCVHVHLCALPEQFWKFVSLSISGRKTEASRAENIYKFCKKGQLAEWVFYIDLFN